MDAKYLAEIRARGQMAKVEKQKGNDLDCACLSWAIVLNDLPALLAEVERLTDIEKEYLHYRRLSEKLDQQIATLKGALVLACRYHNFDDFGTIRSEMDFFIRQAQEQEEKS